MPVHTHLGIIHAKGENHLRILN
ncbi:hypothetical protein KL86DES1_10294 [uncultured Desulfovibrio sp.]|uniref:Uncharacterized protein n=1 Tax=uncultured Desulfovibrio sp. TaxID=167968 RepID=A0A212KYQ7_9BACT|nr:hypothetical protein KL86DES1_10294 [uncultured Desulfovibrio sp.]